MPKPVFKPNRFKDPSRIPRLGTIPEDPSPVTADVVSPAVETPLKSTAAFTKESRIPTKLSNLKWAASEPRSDVSDACSIQKSERELKLESRIPTKLSNFKWAASEPRPDLSDACSIQKSERELKLDSKIPTKLSNLKWAASEPRPDLSDACSIQKSERELKLYVTKMESNMEQLHTIIQTTDREKVVLLNQLEEEKRKVKELQFRVDEESITRQNLEYVTEMESKMDQLHTMTKTTDREKKLLNQLEEEKRKVEELHFRIDEELIAKQDLEMQTNLQHACIKELEDSLLLEKIKVMKLQKALEDTKYVTKMESKMDQLPTIIQTTDREKVVLLNQLEEEKRNVEALQFLVDEETITKWDVESPTCVSQSLRREVDLIREERRALKAEKDTLVREAEALEIGKESLLSMTVEIESYILSLCEELKPAKKIMCEKENLDRKYRELHSASQTLTADREKLIAELHRANQDLLEIGLDYEELKSKQNKLNVKVTNLLQEKDKLTEQIAAVTSQHYYSEKDNEELQLAQERLMMINGEMKTKIKRKAINLKQVFKMLNKV